MFDPSFRVCVYQAKESGFVFGAYTHCKWPQGMGLQMADATGQSFVFSLVNAADQAVHFLLRNRNKAIALDSDGIYFGLGRANIILNYDGAAADEAEGNMACPFDEDSAYQPVDEDVNCDFLAGSKYFAAADIEVYELRQKDASRMAGGSNGAVVPLPVSSSPSSSSSASSPRSPGRLPGLEPLERLQSLILEPTCYWALLRFYGPIRVSRPCTCRAVLQSSPAMPRTMQQRARLTALAFSCCLTSRAQIPSRLLYRASRDGFEFDDWKARCAGKGPTMTLVKVSRPQPRRIQSACELPLFAGCWRPALTR